MLQPFKAVSLSFKKAPLEIRELIALDEAACRRFLHTLHHELGLSDLLVLSTCNRTEVYYSAERDQSPTIIEALGELKGLADISQYFPYFDILDEHTSAVRHLFEVAMGLDAQVVGDLQISNQVKQAYQWSADEDAAGPFLHRVLHTVFFTNKRVQQETSFRDGAASTSYAALELVEELTGDVANPRVLVVGLGEIGADVCRHLGDSKLFTDVTICNRTRSKAEALAEECGLKVLDFENLVPGMKEADVIISSISRSEPFFTTEMVERLDVLNYKFFIDLSVPRSIEADVENVPGVLVYNIDAIHSKASAALERRLAAVPQVRAIIEESLAGLQDWTKEMMVSPTIQKLKNALEQIRLEEMDRFQKKMTPEEARRVDDITKSLMQKVLKLPVLQLKAACKRGEADQLIDVLTDLFDLERQPDLA
ncbi:glutamyl-tRNA reductase [Hymenobacter taeanensis]|uniref:Glutamyl-tRNA reductase n=1 Tax=Hymenobacter taeanensis TaxID=2735321 RepID=A0A6M6BFY6_9BACT|nr:MULTISPECIES: glutamyl-tRNA reductase [Hymenobacter]QJX46889.1 glutamyl-tRNA reductase [Hymenobacter taeanensis]UOQ80762.1 glutamyl-tRNA reductase [Hymenobacter sp. 5414T-23]